MSLILLPFALDDGEVLLVARRPLQHLELELDRHVRATVRCTAMRCGALACAVLARACCAQGAIECKCQGAQAKQAYARWAGVRANVDMTTSLHAEHDSLQICMHHMDRLAAL
jgi:hypothetical protein